MPLSDSLTRILRRKQGWMVESISGIRRNDRNGADSSGGKLPARDINARVYVPMRMLLDLDQIAVGYSNVVDCWIEGFLRRVPGQLKGIVRACPEGVVAAADHHKEMALKLIAEYTRLKDPKVIEELHDDAIRF